MARGREPNPSACRIALRGSASVADEARRALAGSGIELAYVEREGLGTAEGSSRERLDACVSVISSGTDRVASDVKRLGEELGSLPLIVVLDWVGGKTARAVLQSGARGIVLGSQLDEALAPTVRAIQAGLIAIPQSTRHQVFRPVLSHRENTVLAMVALGRTNAQIASSLQLEESTVKSHVRSLFTKLGVKSRKEAAAEVTEGDSRLISGVLAVTETHQTPLMTTPGERLVSS